MRKHCEIVRDALKCLPKLQHGVGMHTGKKATRDALSEVFGKALEGQ